MRSQAQRSFPHKCQRAVVASVSADLLCTLAEIFPDKPFDCRDVRHAARNDPRLKCALMFLGIADYTAKADERFARWLDLAAGAYVDGVILAIDEAGHCRMFRVDAPASPENLQALSDTDQSNQTYSGEITM